jgi:hypothetical protein
MNKKKAAEVLSIIRDDDVYIRSIHPQSVRANNAHSLTPGIAALSGQYLTTRSLSSVWAVGMQRSKSSMR